MIVQRKRSVIRVGPRLAGLPPDEPAQAPAVAVREPESVQALPVPAVDIVEPKERSAKFHCPQCERDFTETRPNLYDLVVCPECSTDLKVIRIEPLTLVSLDQDESKDQIVAELEEKNKTKSTYRSGGTGK